MRGITAILITGRTFTEVIPIGADTSVAIVMTGIFMINTTVARAEVGKKDSIGMAITMAGAVMMAVDTVMMAVAATMMEVTK